MRALEKNIKGFNILELMIVIAIVGLISALSFPNIASWTKERETRNAAQKIITLMTNINSQVQRGKYGFVQVFVQDLKDEDDETKQIVIVKSKGMKMNTLMTMVKKVVRQVRTRIPLKPTLLVMNRAQTRSHLRQKSLSQEATQKLLHRIALPHQDLKLRPSRNNEGNSSKS